MKAAKMYALLGLLVLFTVFFLITRTSNRFDGSDELIELLGDLRKKMQLLDEHQRDLELDLDKIRDRVRVKEEDRVAISGQVNNVKNEDMDQDWDQDREVKLAKELLVAPDNLPLNISDDRPLETSAGQAQLIRKLFKEERGGFFVECGALDGVTRSNTLTLERDLGWSGLLIEGDWKSVISIKETHRKAWLMPTCLSVKPHAMNVSFMAIGHIGRIGGSPRNRPKTDLTCLPLHSMLRALDRNTVDYFSLDVEGAELEVLHTIPFDEVEIKALSVEKAHIGKDEARAGSSEELLTFMMSMGYKKRAEVVNRLGKANDYIFVKEGFNEDVQLEDILT